MAGTAWPGLGEQLKKARERAGLSIDDAAAQVGVDVDVWNRWEAGEDEPFFRDGMEACRVLGVGPEQLMPGIGA
jgi:transcriptional regulator with XRE-family HTH domain